jgi:hypothetical protein
MSRSFDARGQCRCARQIQSYNFFLIPKSVFVLCLNIKKKLLIFFINLNCFNVMILKINFKNKKLLF